MLPLMTLVPLPSSETVSVFAPSEIFPLTFIAGALPSTLSEELPPSVIAPLNVMLPPEPPVE